MLERLKAYLAGDPRPTVKVLTGLVTSLAVYLLNLVGLINPSEEVLGGVLIGSYFLASWLVRELGGRIILYEPEEKL